MTVASNPFPRAADPIGYRTDCPSCGQEMQAVALAPDTAPWLCNECHRGFWAAELTDVARARYRVRFHDWGRGTPASAIRQSVQAEWLKAHERGTSLRFDQIRHTPDNALRGIANRSGVHPAMANAIGEWLGRRP